MATDEALLEEVLDTTEGVTDMTDENQSTDGQAASNQVNTEGWQFPTKSGKRKIIKYGVDTAMPMFTGVDPDEDAEQERRKSRALKFGLTTEDDLQRREERAKKFGTSGPIVPQLAKPKPTPEAPAVPEDKLVTQEDVERSNQRASRFGIPEQNPLDLITKNAGKKAIWEDRRDPAVEETPRPEAVYIYGTDKMSTKDILEFFLAFNPQWVEWINDSSALCVFADETIAGSALEQLSVPLATVDGPTEVMSKVLSWRTLLPSMPNGGKGLQLCFRLATNADVKPAKRAASRWYAQSEDPAERRKAKADKANKAAAAARAAAAGAEQVVADAGVGKHKGIESKRAGRKAAAAPYARKILGDLRDRLPRKKEEAEVKPPEPAAALQTSGIVKGQFFDLRDKMRLKGKPAPTGVFSYDAVRSKDAPPEATAAATTVSGPSLVAVAATPNTEPSTGTAPTQATPLPDVPELTDADLFEGVDMEGAAGADVDIDMET